MSISSFGSTTRAAALLAGVLALATLTACGSGSGSPAATKTVTAANGSTSAQAPSSGAASSASAAPSTPPKPVKYVHVSLLNSDGTTYGVGMPVIAFFSQKIVSAKDWQADTKVTVNGKPVTAAWYFEPSSASPQAPYEAHLRMQTYWPAHSAIHVDFPKRGTSLGGDLVADGKLQTLDFSTGAKHISLVNDATHTITVTSDGKQVYQFPVSLGATNTPTRSGIKVIMEKGASICMHGPGYNECGVKYTQRLTYDGEYLHAAPWNTYNIAHGIDSSNGCTNMTTQNAETLYNFLRIGDVVTYPNANGPAMTLGEGYGDWNVSWQQWLTGGAFPTH